VGQLSDPFEQGEDDELGITISGLPGEREEPEPEPDDASAGAGDAPDDGTSGESITYDLDDWSELERQAIAERLREAGIPHGWDGTALQIAAVDEAAVENVLDIVEGEAGPPLDADRDQVAYDLTEWDDDQVNALAHELTEAGIAFAWEVDELHVYAEDEQAVDELLDRVAHPHELAAEPDDGHSGAELLGEIFVAADRLQHGGDDHEGTLTMLDMGRAIDVSEPPYGLGRPEWTRLCERVTSLGSLLQAESVDRDAVMESARDLRSELRPYV
jgi:hypothetical protein